MTGEETDKVTRIQIHTELGRYEFWADHWNFKVQDDGMTLFLLGQGEGKYARKQRDIARANDQAEAKK